MLYPELFFISKEKNIIRVISSFPVYLTLDIKNLDITFPIFKLIYFCGHSWSEWTESHMNSKGYEHNHKIMKQQQFKPSSTPSQTLFLDMELENLAVSARTPSWSILQLQVPGILSVILCMS